MKIERCSFGIIKVDGIEYNSDIIIYPDGRIVDTWRRKSGHRLEAADIIQLIKSSPELIIAGTGVNEKMEPDPSLIKRLNKEGIGFIFRANRKAMDLFNSTSSDMKTGACFHLTC